MFSGGAWRDWICVGFGVWLLTLPMMAGIAVDDGFNGWNAFLSGLAVAGVGLAALEQPGETKQWAKLVLGVWLSLSPFLLGFWHDPVLLWSCLLPGLVVAGDAFVAVGHFDRPAT